VVNTISIEEYFKLLNLPEIQVFIFLLGDECLYLNSPGHWVHSLKWKTHLVRMELEGFSLLHIGKHPKIMLYKSGKELIAINGIPDYQGFKHKIKDLL